MSWPVWSGETVVVAATGPSAADVDLSIGRGKAKYLAVKDAARLPEMCPWADALYACDHHWWLQYGGLMPFRGIRICFDARTVEKWRGIDWLRVTIPRHQQRLMFDKVGEIGWGGNSGFHAINLAAQFGAAKIILVGFDMRIDRGKHLFGPHPYTQERPSQANVDKWRTILDREAPVLRDRGIEVINCSPVSTLTAFPKMSFEEALA